MKKRDIAAIVIAVVIFVVAAGLVYRYFAPPTKDSQVKVTVPHQVSPDFDNGQLQDLGNPSLHDYTPDITPNFPDKSKVF